jgi:hypothetical protein
MHGATGCRAPPRRRERPAVPSEAAMIPLPMGPFGDFAERILVRIPRQRAINKMQTIREQSQFAREFELVHPDQEAELVEMLLSGASLGLAVSELRGRG